MKVGTQIMDAIFHKIHNEGYKFIAISIFVTFILLLISKFILTNHIKIDRTNILNSI